MKRGFVYILTNKQNGTLYVGVTSDLVRRVWEHKNRVVEGFTKRYGLDKLVYYEAFEDIENAILREKQLKGKSRQKKLDLITEFNPCWIDLYKQICL